MFYPRLFWGGLSLARQRSIRHQDEVFAVVDDVEFSVGPTCPIFWHSGSGYMVRRYPLFIARNKLNRTVTSGAESITWRGAR